MANILVIEEDPRIQTQIRQFLSSMTDNHIVRFFKDSKALHERFFPRMENAEENSLLEAPENADASAPLEVLGTVNMVIFNASNVDSPFKAWVERMREEIQEKGLLPENNTTRFIAMKYEDDGVDNSEFFHSNIDDLICLPLDRLLFLQKVEFILALPRKISPTFLFNQEASLDIEVSKKSQIKEISDFGLAIYNPVALNLGVVTHFYFTLPGQKEILSLHGKVLFTKPHPKNEKMFIIYFMFFGLSKENLKKLRTFLTKISNYKAVKINDPTRFAYSATSSELSYDQKRKKVVAIIDVDQHSCSTTKDLLLEGMGQIDVITSLSYYLFFKEYLTDRKETENNISIPVQQEELYTETIEWRVSHLTQEFTQGPQDLEEDHNIVDHKAQEVFASPDGWKKLFDHPDSRALISEMFAIVETKGVAERLVDLVAVEGSLRKVSLQLKLTENKREIVFSMTAPKVEAKTGHSGFIETLDAIIINSALVPAAVQEWIDGLQAASEKRGLSSTDRRVKIILVGEESPAFLPKIYKVYSIDGMIYKPVESRRLQCLLSNLINSPFTLYQFDNISWIPSAIPVYVAKESHLESISEYGVTLLNERNFNIGTTLYLHGGIFDLNTERVVCGRMYYSKESEKERGKFSCSFLYFGIDEEFLKYIRKWIRTNYARTKIVSGN